MPAPRVSVNRWPYVWGHPMMNPIENLVEKISIKVLKEMLA